MFGLLRVSGGVGGYTSCCEEICRVDSKRIFMSTFVATEETLSIYEKEIPALLFTRSPPLIQAIHVDPFHGSSTQVKFS